MIREAFRTILLGNTPVSNGVGGSRIFPQRMPQGERGNSLVYQRAGGVQDLTLDGPSGLRETRMQVDAWAEDIDDAAALMILAEQALNGYSGLVPVGDDSPQQIVRIKGIFYDGEREGFDSDAKLYRDGRDFRVMWCPAAN